MEEQTMMNGKNPFFDVDMTKVMADMRMPALDVESVVATQRKNIEAFTQANQLAVEGFQAIARRQVEIAKQAFEEFQSALRELTQPGSPEHALEKGVANAREIAEIVTKANSEAMAVLNKRVSETLDEVRDFAKKRTAR
jgi:phasin family protein